MSKRSVMVLKRISVVVLICFLSFADAENCPSTDLEQAKAACGEQETCITINGQIATSDYEYSKKMNLKIECHYTGVSKTSLGKNFIVQWEKGGIKERETKCRNLKTVVQLSPDSNNVIYTCVAKYTQSVIDGKHADLRFTYVPEELKLKETATPNPPATDERKLSTKLKMYINNEVKEVETIENRSEIVYTYNQENITIEVKCSHVGEVNNSRLISWETKQLESTYKGNTSSYLKHPDTIIIPLFADQSNSYLDCVEHLGNQVNNSTTDTSQPTRIRLWLIYENLTMNKRLKLFFESHWIVLATVFVLIVVVIVVVVAICAVLKLRKSPKEDKRRLNPKGSREGLEDTPKHHKETHPESKLNEHYSEVQADNVSEVYYSDPYSAMYTQPMPKNARYPKVLPKLQPKPKPRNIENYSNTCGLVYGEPSTYNNIASNTRRIYNNVAKNTGATYNQIDKSSKNTRGTYCTRVHFYDNMAASYSNTENEKYSSDMYSEPGIYEEPS